MKMFHRLVIERLFTLGDYKNIKIIAETDGIPDEVWNDADEMEKLRDRMTKELFASYARHMLMLGVNMEYIKTGSYEEMYKTNR